MRWAATDGAALGAKKGLSIPSLDGLRALSFLLVFVAHAGAERVVPGSFGVTVFFFLSGYLITTLLRVEHAKTGAISLRDFYQRRALRILPPLYIVLVIAAALTYAGLLASGLENSELALSGVIAQALQFGNYWLIDNGGYDGLPRGTGVFWSLAVEWHFYLLFPLVFATLLRRGVSARQQASVLLGLCGLVLLWRFVLVTGVGVSQFRTNLSTDTRFDSLLFGCALAVHGNPALDATRVRAPIWKYVLLPAGILGLLVSFLVRNETFRETLRYSLQGLCLVPVFVCAVRYSQWLPMRLLGWAPLKFIGTLSYSLYLVHHVVIYLLEESFIGTLGEWPVGALAFAISFAVSWLLYEAVEKPCARVRRRLHGSAPAVDGDAAQPASPPGSAQREEPVREVCVR